MPRHSGRPDRAILRAAVCLAIAMSLISEGPPSAEAAAGGSSSPPAARVSGADLAARGWVWPAARFRLARPFVAPAHPYGPGHRGVDLDLLGGSVVRAPADGFVAFAGSVAGRGILTIDHGDGLVTTLEPVVADLVAGTPVRRGEDVAALALGGHAVPGQLHFGVRLDGEYVNPLLLLGGVPRAVLLPCCESESLGGGQARG